MAYHLINSNPTYITDVTVRETDEHTRVAYVKFNRTMFPGKTLGTSEMYITPQELEDFGKFLQEQAKEIKAIQENRLRLSAS